MKSKEVNYDYWFETINRNYQQRYSFLVNRIEAELNSILEINEVGWFNNAFLNACSEQLIIRPTLALVSLIEKKTGNSILSYDFAIYHKQMVKDCSELSSIMHNCYFAVMTKSVFEDLKKIPLFLN